MSTNKDTGSKLNLAIIAVLVLATVAGAYMIGKNNGKKETANLITLAAPASQASQSQSYGSKASNSTNPNSSPQNASKRLTSNIQPQSYGVFYLDGTVNSINDKFISVKTKNGQIIKVASKNGVRVLTSPTANKTNKVTVVKSEQNNQPKQGTSSSSNTQSNNAQQLKNIKVGTKILLGVKVNPDGTFEAKSVRISK